jgi:taurine--2-oxoglutarate transaminase
MNDQEMIDLCKQHTLYTWAATGAVHPLPVASAKGVYLYDGAGNKTIDFNSQLMSVHVGHGHPKVVEAVKKQLDTLSFAFPGAATPVRARVGKLLAEVVPGDINTFFFTNAGAEANENAIRAVRLYTGRSKILARYRSYHGGTNLTMRLTGDPRRWANEPGPPGIIHTMDPWPYDYSFGDNDAEIVANNLRYLEEVITYEGPQNIAAMIIESVTGTNGILPPPKGYLEGLRALLDKHDILLICDEVMAGFGRTGKMFGFEHGGIVPDVVTMAKGLTSSYVPLGAVGLSDKIAKHFQENVFWGGLTYNSHPVGLAAAEASIQVIREEGLVERSAKMGAVMRGHMERMQDKHPTVRGFRQIGLFGMMDLRKNEAGERAAPYNGSSPMMAAVGKVFREEGLFTFVRWGSFMCNPPLCITEAELEEAFVIIDKALTAADEHFER